MVPKFRGGSDDWLDEEDEEGSTSAGARPSTHLRRKPAKNDRAKFLPADQANATVAEVYPRQCRVRLDSDGTEFLASYRRAGVIRQDDERERSPVAVGDRVLADRTSPQSGVIEGICERRNSLSRPAPGRETRKVIHVVAANIDDLVIVTSAKEPLFTPGLVDRYLVAASAAGIRPLLCLNKIDLVDPSTIELPTRLYRELGYRVFEMGSKKGIGVEPLRQEILGRSVVFCGQSGVGKTSLLRVLTGADIGRIGNVSEATGKGKHTTTAAVLLRGPEGSQWIDTPGVREFGLNSIEPEALAAHFPEFRDVTCQLPDCRHVEEPGCKARELERHGSYLRIHQSLVSGEH